jgi:hypothetical protein
MDRRSTGLSPVELSRRFVTGQISTGSSWSFSRPPLTPEDGTLEIRMLQPLA